jgi:ketosteroid isomerase-like protein
MIMQDHLVAAGRPLELQTIVNQKRRRTIIVLAVGVALLTFILACQQQSPADTRATDENDLREWDAQWSSAAAAKNVDKTVSYYADDVIVLPPNGPTVTSKEGIRKIWLEMLTAPGFSGGWKATKVEVARSGDLAFLSGTWEFTMNDASGKPSTDRGKFVEVVKKQADGSWKCVTDIWNSDLPLPAPTPEE